MASQATLYVARLTAPCMTKAALHMASQVALYIAR
jgi:hypothetical protein